VRHYLNQTFKRIFNRLDCQAGMSLVETLIAVAILGVSAGALVLALSAGSLAVNTNDEIASAQALAQTQIEAIKAAPYDMTGATYALIIAPTGYSLLVNTDSTVYGNGNIQKVTIEIYHGEGNKILSLEDYKVNR
jgi:prepilin-type N-terminal cleavage/methylation domain-containing protein